MIRAPFPGVPAPCVLTGALCHNDPAAGAPAAGLGGPNNRRTQPPTSGFFVSAAWQVLYGRAVWGALGLAGSYCRSANLHGSSSLLGGGEGGKIRSIGVIAMTAPSRSPSLSPARLRANWHRRMAFACLRANSSAAVRLERYRAHIEQARALESQGVCHG